MSSKIYNILRDITFLSILTFNAKCCKHLTSFVFGVRYINDNVELELSFLQCLSLERANRSKYVFKNLQHFALISYLYKI